MQVQTMQRAQKAQRVQTTVLGIAIAGLGFAGAATAACWDPNDPSIILRCYEQAAAATDIEALKGLLAADYVREVSPTQKRTVEVSRDEEVRAWRQLFMRGGKPHLVYKPGYKVVKGQQADTWRIENASWQNDVEFIQKGEPTTKKTTSATNTTLLIRKVGTPEPRYEIWKIVEAPVK